MPLAPALFSTITDCFSSSVSWLARMRAMLSWPPPGANGTTSEITFDGFDCAAAFDPVIDRAARRIANSLIERMVISPSGRDGPHRGRRRQIAPGGEREFVGRRLDRETIVIAY